MRTAYLLFFSNAVNVAVVFFLQLLQVFSVHFPEVLSYFDTWYSSFNFFPSFLKLKINKTLGVTAYSYKFPLILLITTILSVRSGNKCLVNPKMDKRYTEWCLQSHWYDYEHLVIRIHLGYAWRTQNVVRDLAYEYLPIFNTAT